MFDVVLNKKKLQRQIIALLSKPAVLPIFLQEIACLKQENSYQKEEISNLCEKVEKYELLATELESLREANEHLKVGVCL